MKRVNLFREKLSTIVIMVVYFCSVFPVYTFHHHERICNHDKEEEIQFLDACHLTLYHPGTEIHCSHTFHISPVSIRCGICKDYSIGLGINIETELFFTENSHFPETVFKAGFEYPSEQNLPVNRGPPIENEFF